MSESGAALIAAAVHRMSQPLTVLRGTLELALGRAGGAAAEREQLQLALREAERLAALTEALRALAACEPAPCADAAALRAAASAVLEELAPLAAARSLRLEAAPELAEAPAAQAGRPLCQALLRLAGGSLERAAGRLELRLATGMAGGCGLEIADDGAALDAAAWRRLFDPFAANAEIRSALGHALAECAIAAGGGGLEMRDAGGGNVIRVAYPLAVAGAPPRRA